MTAFQDCVHAVTVEGRYIPLFSVSVSLFGRKFDTDVVGSHQNYKFNGSGYGKQLSWKDTESDIDNRLCIKNPPIILKIAHRHFVTHRLHTFFYF